jgi:hypothetical protein
MRGDEGRDRETRNAYSFVVRTTNFALRKMRANGSKSNQSSDSVDALVSEVLAALSPNETR